MVYPGSARAKRYSVPLLYDNVLIRGKYLFLNKTFNPQHKTTRYLSPYGSGFGLTHFFFSLSKTENRKFCILPARILNENNLVEAFLPIIKALLLINIFSAHSTKNQLSPTTRATKKGILFGNLEHRSDSPLRKFFIPVRFTGRPLSILLDRSLGLLL